MCVFGEKPDKDRDYLWFLVIAGLLIMFVFRVCSQVEGNEEGRSIYYLHCAKCHGLPGDASFNLMINKRVRYAPAFYLCEKTNQSRESMIETINRGKENVRYGTITRMPAWGVYGVLCDDEINAVAKYVRGLCQ